MRLVRDCLEYACIGMGVRVLLGTSSALLLQKRRIITGRIFVFYLPNSFLVFLMLTQEVTPFGANMSSTLKDVRL